MPVRVLVVEDSLTVRMRIVEILGGDPDLEVVGAVDDGRQAIEACQRLKPDVITLDMMLPVMTGVAVTEYIMAFCPTPILIVSASTNRGELFKTYEALAAGALDVLEKPLGDERDAQWDRQLIARVKLVARVKVITHLRARLPSARRAPTLAPPVHASAPNGHRLIAIGASTGGPAALLTILRALPPSFPLPIVLVLHVASAFAGAFAEWLDGLSPLRVRYARDGERLPEPGQGQVLMAVPDRHLVVRGERLHFSDAPERHSCRPSIDVLFDSLAATMGREVVACLLTGMGRDGATGLQAIRQAGGRTYAQDEATSVVFGMPGEAVRLGAAEQVLPVGEFAGALTALAAAAQRGRTS